MYYITDYVSNPNIETKILGSPLYAKNFDQVKVLLVWHQNINTEFLNKFPNLIGVVRYGVGFDNIDLEEIRRRKLVFCNTPDYGVDEVSDSAVAMILNISRGVSRYDYFCRNFDDGTWQENTIEELVRNCETNIGVIGAGRIGGSVLRKVRYLGYKARFYDPYVSSGYEKMIGAGRLHDLEELLEISDIVSVHTPLTEETRSLVDMNFIRNMKKGASLVVTARGEIVESLDVIDQGLKSNQLSNVALDVLPAEPPDFDHPLIHAWKTRQDWLDGRLLINPHAAYYSQQAYAEMRSLAAQNAKRILDHDTPINIILDGRE